MVPYRFGLCSQGMGDAGKAGYASDQGESSSTGSISLRTCGALAAMQFDASIPLSLFDRKRARLETLAVANEPEVWFDALVRLMKWMLAEPMLRAYVKQIVANYDTEERVVMRALRKAPERLAAAAKEFRAKCQIPDEGAGWPAPNSWEQFDGCLKSAEATDCPPERFRNDVHVAAGILEQHAKQAVETTRLASNQADAILQKLVERDAHIVSSDAPAGGSGPPRELAELPRGPKSVEGARSAAYQAFEHERQLANAVLDLTIPTINVLNVWKQEEAHSPRAALARLLGVCRGVAPPLQGVSHWSDVLDTDRWLAHATSRNIREKPERYRTEALRDLGLLAEELHVMGASSLSYGVVVERFAERCAWYDKERMRAVAKRGAGKREDRLTLELAKYMHDCGTFVLVRPRVSNLEPDVVALRGLAIEAKAYESSSNARRDLVDGYYQLHAYMTSLETRALPVREGFLVAFRLGGPIYETPRTMTLGRFLIHSITIDLGESKDSGRKQPRPVPVTVREIREGVRERRAGAKAARRRTSST